MSSEESNEFYDPNFHNHLEIVCSCLSFVYAFPAFYTVIRLGVLYYRGRLPGSFYKLLFVFGINDILSYSVQMVTLRLPYWGILHFYDRIMTGFFPTFLYFTMNASSYAQVCGCVFMAANRASSVVIPHSYERLWKTYGWFLILSVTISIQYLNYDIIVVGAQYWKVGTAVYLIGVVENYADTGFQTCYVCLTGSFVTLLLNIYTGISLHHHMKVRNRAVNLMESKFFNICVITFVCQLLWTLKQFAVHYATPLSPLQLYAFMVGPTVTDVNCLFPIYSILIMSKDIRTQIFACRGNTTKQDQSHRGPSIITVSSRNDVPAESRSVQQTGVSKF